MAVKYIILNLTVREIWIKSIIKHYYLFIGLVKYDTFKNKHWCQICKKTEWKSKCLPMLIVGV